MKTVVVTGACGGIGQAVCKKLIENGFQVFGLDFCDSKTDFEVIKTDVTSLESVENAFEIIRQKTDKIDVIVHLAGIYDMNSLVEIDEKEFVKIFDVNFFGMFRVNKVFFPLLKPKSRILLTSSELAPLNQLPFNGLYGMTKSLVEKYAFSLRMELSLLGIDVFVLRPGAVQTKLLNASTLALDKFCQNTKNYSFSANKFKEIVNKVESKSVPPTKIAEKVFKILTAKKPKYITKINANKGLRLLSALPKSLQVKIIKKLLLSNKKKH